MKKGLRTDSPLPPRVVSNEEFPPPPPTAEQQRLEHAVDELAERTGRKLGLSRREFLRTTGGMAAALLAMNQVFGRYFDVLDVELAEAAAVRERRGESPFVFDVQTHYVSAGYDPVDAEARRTGGVSKQALLGLRRRARELGLNPALADDRGTVADLSWENFIKEVFLDSETSIGMISTPPGPYPWEAVVPPKEMTHIRDEINRVAGSQRMLAHGIVAPQLGQVDRDFMERQAEEFQVDAWKCYTGAAPKGFAHGWWMSDEQVAYPMLEKAQGLGVTKICVHKGLPLGPVAEYNHPRDLIQAARDFPDLAFLVYHSGFLGTHRLDVRAARAGEIPWTSEFCRLKRAHPGLRNIYMELGSTFAQLVVTHPEICAHLLGQLIDAFGDDRVVWGTDSIWYGSPQWQIEAFRRFQIPDALLEKKGYRPLSAGVKAGIVGLNAARLFGVDVAATRHDLPRDYLSRIKMAYQEEGPEPSHRWYGWVSS